MKAVLVTAGILAAFAGLFVAGYLPRQARQSATVEAAHREEAALPSVRVVQAKRSTAQQDVVLPGNVQAIAETPVYARAEGYIVKRHVDIGDRVRAGQVLVEIDSPEQDQELRQARARVAQSRAALAQAQAQEAQAAANVQLAETTLGRWRELVQQGILSRQEGDEKQAIHTARQADLLASQANVQAARENILAVEAEVARIVEMDRFKNVTAPFDGTITVRNCAVGNLITPSALASGRELFRLADSRVLRVFVSVPEAHAPAMRVGQPAELTLQEFPSRRFIGHIARTANALDASTRTLLTEVEVRNPEGTLLPGMYAQVRFAGKLGGGGIVVPGDTLVARPDGTYVALLDGDRVRFRKVVVGRDSGTETEILSGLEGGERVVASPDDDVRDGARVKAGR